MDDQDPGETTLPSTVKYVTAVPDRWHVEVEKVSVRHAILLLIC